MALRNEQTQPLCGRQAAHLAAAPEPECVTEWVCWRAGQSRGPARRTPRELWGLLRPLVLLLLAAGTGGHRRRAVTLVGKSPDGLHTCFAPFLDRQVEYRLVANAMWGFGAHVISDSTANISATVLVSTERGSACKAQSCWVHTIGVLNIRQVKSYAMHGSPETQTESMPSESAGFRVRFLQTQCDDLDEIWHSPGVTPQALDFARGLSSMILFALPSEEPFEKIVRREGPNGASPTRLSVRRRPHPQPGKGHVTHVHKSVNESKAPIRLDNGQTVHLRNEVS